MTSGRPRWDIGRVLMEARWAVALAGLLALAVRARIGAGGRLDHRGDRGLCGPRSDRKAVAGAKKEGTVTLYTSANVDDMAVVTAAFEKKYGVKVRVWRGSSENVVQRGVTEARGGRFDADVFETGGAAMESLHREKLLQEVKSPSLADLDPAALTAHGEWTGTRYNVFVAAYNTKLIKKDDLPKELRRPRSIPNGRASSASRPTTATGSAP